MKMRYELKEYSRKTIKVLNILPIPTKAHAALNKIIRLPSKVASPTIVSLSYPVTPQDVALVEKTLTIKLDVKKRFYVIEVTKG